MPAFLAEDGNYLNTIEPQRYVDLFVQYPPRDFIAGTDQNMTIFFRTKFDLFTTMDMDTLAKAKNLPFFGWWSMLFRLSTCFVGTTITEYTPIPYVKVPELLFESMTEEAGKQSSLVIFKDLPVDSPLLSEEENDYAQTFADRAAEKGFFEVCGQVLAYVPVDFADTDEYLKRLSASRRKDLRRKMKTFDDISIETLKLGDAFFADDRLLDEFYDMYVAVFQQSEVHFDLLSREFFAALLRDSNIDGVVVIYRYEGDIACYNICLLHNGMFIDKYIGFKYPLARKLNLYFLSWLYNLELAKKYGCAYYVAGWTDPEVKASLGAKFTFTRHLVWVKNPLLRKMLKPLKGFFESDRKAMEAL